MSTVRQTTLISRIRKSFPNVLFGLTVLLPASSLRAQTEWSNEAGCEVLRGLPEEWNGFALGSPDVILVDGEYHLWLSASPPDPPVGCAPYAIGQFASADGCAWEPDEKPVLEASFPWQGDRVSGPEVLATDDGLLLFYHAGGCPVERSALGYAESTDGGAWIDRSAEPLFAPAVPWEFTAVRNPVVVRAGDTYHLFYSAGAFAEDEVSIRTWRLGHATSSDPVDWSRSARNPLFSARDIADVVDAPLGIYGQEVIWHQETASFEMWFTVVTEGLASDYITYVTSLDGDSWEVDGRVSIEGDFSPSVGHPAVLWNADEKVYEMWYVVSDGFVFWREMRRATAPWTRPRASFTVEPVEGRPLTLRLDASRSRAPRDSAPGDTITRYTWDLGDGRVVEGRTVDVEYEAPGEYRITLAVTDSAGETGRVARVEVVYLPSGPVDPWEQVDVGPVTLPGNSRRAPDDPDCFEIQAAIGDITRTEDSCHFVYQRVTGDFRVQARITDWNAHASGSMAGLLARESLDAGARSAAVALRRGLSGQGGTIRYVLRDEVDRDARSSRLESYEGPAGWLRLERAGDTVRVWFSAEDPPVWTDTPDERVVPGLADELLVGAFGAGRSRAAANDLAWGRFCNLEILPTEELPPRFLRGDADASGALDLTDGIYILNFLFLGGTRPSCDDAADSDDSGALDLTDGIYLFDYLFLGGSAPVSPFPECGEDETVEENSPLDCETPHACGFEGA